MVKFNRLVFFNSCGFNMILVGKYKSKYCNLNNSYLNLSKFHTSVCLFSDKEEDRSAEKRIQELKGSIDSSSKGSVDVKDISLSKEEYDEMKRGLLDFKNEVSNVCEKDVNDEFNSVKDYLNSTHNNISSIEEAFPNYMKQKEGEAMLRRKIEGEDAPQKKIEGEDILNDEISVFKIVKELKEVIEKCKSSGNAEECLNQLKLSKVVGNVLTNNSSEDLNSKVKGAYFEEILNTVGNMTLLELYEKVKQIDSKLELKIALNYKEVGLSLVSYGLLMKGFNKYVYNRPIPKQFQGEDLKTILRAKHVGRIFFGTILAPFMIFSFHQVRSRYPLFNVNVTKNIESDNNLGKSSIFGFFAFIKGVNK